MSSSPEASEAQFTPPYSVLAIGYDVVMSHVDYELWAEFVHELIEQHQPDAETVLELGCGTGTLAITMAQRAAYRYLATDRSETMIKVARRKADMEGIEARFELADFTDFNVDTPVDVILLLYDGLNYLLEEDDVLSLFRCTHEALRPGGIFIVDQSTPSNSVNNEAFFEDSNQVNDFSYVRKSRYDSKTRLHETKLEMTIGDRQFVEEHTQRAYEREEVRSLLGEVGFAVDAAYDGFSTEPATDESERIHWVLRRSESPAL